MIYSIKDVYFVCTHYSVRVYVPYHLFLAKVKVWQSEGSLARLKSVKNESGFDRVGREISMVYKTKSLRTFPMWVCTYYNDVYAF